MTTPRGTRRLATGAALVALAALVLGVLPAVTGAAGARAAMPPPGPRAEDGAAPAGANDWGCRPTRSHPRPVVLVHGLGATAAENWAMVAPVLHDAGYCTFALTYGERPDNPSVGGVLPMQESARELAAFVDRVLAATGAAQVDLVGHSEGTVVPQWWLLRLGGAPKVHRFVAIAGLFDGTNLHRLDDVIDTLKGVFGAQADAVSDGFDASLCGSCQQLLTGSDFYRELYAAGSRSAPEVRYTTITTRTDELVTPYTSGALVAPGATNLVLQELCPLDLSEHLGVVLDPVVLRLVLNALDPAHAQPVSCGPVLGVGLGPVSL